MSDTYFVRLRGRTLGPYALDAIRQMARRAQVGRAHEVSLDGASWAPATAYPEIFERSTTGGGDVVAAVPAEAVANAPLPGRAMTWHYTRGGVQQASPVDQAQLIALLASGQVGPQDHVWCETMADWMTVAQVPELAVYALPPSGSHAATPQANDVHLPSFVQAAGGQSPLYRQFVGKKVAAGVCALFLGSLGVHKFMLGLTSGGLTMLILFLLILPIPVLSVISLAEAIIYLSKSDEQFFRDYAVNRKQWF